MIRSFQFRRHTLRCLAVRGRLQPLPYFIESTTGHERQQSVHKLVPAHHTTMTWRFATRNNKQLFNYKEKLPNMQ